MKAEPFETGVVTISLDTELGWGRINSGRFEDIASRLDEGKEAIRRLIDVFERYDVPATWAVVGQLCRRDPPRPPDTGSVSVVPDTADVPWDRDWWHAPELLQAIVDSPVDHELGSHSGNHLLFDECDPETAALDLSCVPEWCELPATPRSFVFPQNAVGHLDVLAEHGFRCYRGRPPRLGAEPTPTAFLPEQTSNVVNVPACVAYRHHDGRNVLFRNLPRPVKVIGLKAGVSHAARRGRVFHVVLHPKDFTCADGEDLLTGLEEWLEFVVAKREQGRIETLPMGAVERQCTFR